MFGCQSKHKDIVHKHVPKFVNSTDIKIELLGPTKMTLNSPYTDTAKRTWKQDKLL